jgi:hypothetical protein
VNEVLIFLCLGSLFSWYGFGVSYFMFLDSKAHKKNMWLFCVFWTWIPMVSRGVFLNICVHVFMCVILLVLIILGNNLVANNKLNHDNVDPPFSICSSSKNLWHHHFFKFVLDLILFATTCVQNWQWCLVWICVQCLNEKHELSKCLHCFSYIG